MMFLVRAAHRGINNGNLWDLRTYYYPQTSESQENMLILLSGYAMIPTMEQRKDLQ